MSMNILVGCDPELFVRKQDKFHSAHGLIKGTKDNPFKVNKGAVQVDGMALEFNIDAAHTEEEFCVNIDTVLLQLQAMVPEYEFAIVPVAEFGMDYMRTQPEEALELGCTPDFNAWTAGANPKPDGERSFRTASGHVHIGWTDGADIYSASHTAIVQGLVKQLDFYLGLPSLLYDADSKRREMYGKAGCYRPKTYGCEYRTLSNAWLLSEERKRWVYRAIQKACTEFATGNNLVDIYGDIQDIINNSDIKAAELIIREQKLETVS